MKQWLHSVCITLETFVESINYRTDRQVVNDSTCEEASVCIIDYVSRSVLIELNKSIGVSIKRIF